MMSADVILIGGGLIGACCADALTSHGMDVILLERGFAASGSSRACDGLILLWDKNPGPELALGKRSVALWEDLVPQLESEIEFRKTGTLLVTEKQAGLDHTHQLVNAAIAEGLSAEPLDTSSLSRLEPGLADDLAGGAYFPDDYQVDPRRATLAILQKAQKQGLVMQINADVQDLKKIGGTNGGWKAITKRNTYCSEFIVIAAGVWSSGLMGNIDVDLPIRPRKGHILVANSGPEALLHPVLEAGYEATVHAGGDELQIALVAEVTSAGTMLIGSSRQFVGFDTSVSWDVLRALARRATRFIPELARAPLIRSYAGLRPWSPDHLPLIGPLEVIDGLYIATGHEGAGICLAPATGEIISKWIAEGQAPELGKAVGPSRFL
jgi:glycine/D-amino acid oxidase-like deaminating enzyme